MHYVCEDSLPRSSRRLAEVGVSVRGPLVLNVLLRRPIRASEFERIMIAQGLPVVVRERALACLALPCWRHGVRLDGAGGAGLYVERDFDTPLNKALCGVFGVSPILAEHADSLARGSGFALGLFGMHWASTGQERLRLYAIARRQTVSWTAARRAVLSLLSTLGLAPAIDVAVRLMRRPHRACLVNLEYRPAGVCVKLEIPDASWDLAAECAGIPPAHPRWKRLMRETPGSIRHLGVRFARNEEPDTTLYLPLARAG